VTADEAPMVVALPGSAQRLRADRPVPPTPDERADVERTGRKARDALGDQRYADAYAAAPADPQDLIDRAPPR
jgi:hypothetical protein